MKKVLLLGASGSIGTQTLDILSKHNDKFVLVAFSVGKRIETISDILNKFPSIKDIYVISETDKENLSKLYPSINFYSEVDGFAKFVQVVDFDICVEALVGMAGLVPAIETLKKDKILCLANKEALVTGGHLINQLLDNGYGKLYPIDSEHVALAKCLTSVKPEDVKSLWITASGGALRDVSLDRLNDMKAVDALKHPNWKMGNKITIDCATMMNKGFEVIEAYYLFRYPLDKIHIKMHKESLVHSYVEFNDGSLIIDYGKPDMHGPIEYALLEKNVSYNLVYTKSLDTLTDCHFSDFDENRYPLTKFAMECLNLGGTKLVALNAANEIAVHAYLEDKIKYLDINKIIKDVVLNTTLIKYPSLDEIIECDKLSRLMAEGMIK